MGTQNTNYIRRKWEAELQQEITVEIWEGLCSEAHKVTNANIWWEFQWKIISRYFRTPQIVTKINLALTGNCWRGCGELGNHLHIFWSCPKLNGFWESIFQTISKVFGVIFPRNPQIAILGVIPETVESRNHVYLLQILLASAKKAITSNWLKKDPPVYGEWLSKV